jgi:hypothetical protein
MPRKPPPLPFLPPTAWPDRKLWLWLTSRRFRQCWRSFGKPSSNHPYMLSNVAVINFWSQPLPEFLSGYDAATQEKHEFSDWLDRVREVDTIFRIYMTSDKAQDDPHHWIKRELYVYGHPASDEPILCVKSAVRM